MPDKPYHNPPWPECEECDSYRTGKPTVGALVALSPFVWLIILLLVFGE